MQSFILRWIVLAAASLVVAPAPARADVCRVSSTGTALDGGLSWTTPTTLQAALQRADCTEIWIAAGVYTPSADGDCAIAFAVHPGQALYGGFAGTENLREQRDPARHRSVLSGDIDGNDVTDADGVTVDADDIVGANSHHVVIIDGTGAAGPVGADTVLDGLTLSGGQAQGAYPASAGAGLYCNAAARDAHCNPTLANLRFMGNAALYYGGALFLRADSGGGGSASPSLRDVVFSGNRAEKWGGALYIKADNGSEASPTIERATFTRNRADQGGAIYNSGRGGGGVANMSLVNATFHANDASIGGAYSGNGAAIYNEGLGGDARITLRHVTFSDNTALGLNHFGGALVSAWPRANALVVNSVFWGNRASDRAQIYTPSGGAVEVRDGIVEGGCPLGVTCERVVDADPQLAALADNGGLTPTQLPAPRGAAVDAGEDAECAASDQRDVSRPQGAHCDLGAVEVQTRRCHVDHAASGANDGTDWANAYVDLQSALRADDCAEVWVARGRYAPVRPVDPAAVSDDERGISFVIAPGMQVYGGFAGDETEREQRDPRTNVTVLSGDIDGNDVTDAHGVVVDTDDLVGGNSLHVVYMGPVATPENTVLDGFVVTAGWANIPSGQDGFGGGLLCLGACSPSLSHLVFSGNFAIREGGAFYAHVYDHPAGASLRDVVFRGNSAVRGGAMAYNADWGIALPDLRNVSFTGNQASDSGGAFAGFSRFAGQVCPRMVNVSFVGNLALSGGALKDLKMDSSPRTCALVLQHVTFSGNSASAGTVLHMEETGASDLHAGLTNAIIWGNEGGAPFAGNRDVIAVVHASIVQGGCQPGGVADCSDVIDADPKLGPLADNGGFAPTLLPGAGSAAVDAADAAFCAETDQRGVARPQGAGCDLGAVEVRSARLGVDVLSAGTVTLQSPQALSGAIAGCTLVDASACAASFSLEAGAPDVRLVTAPATQHVAALDSDCGAVASPVDASLRIPALAADCALRVGFAPNRVGGEVRGLVGSGLKLHLDPGDGGPGETLAVGAGAFTFATAVTAGNVWTVGVASAPTGPAQTCTVSHGSGTMPAANVDDVAIDCETDRFPLGGGVQGLAGSGLKLALHSDGVLLEERDVAATGTFAFDSGLIEDQDYAVTITAQPAMPTQTCALDHSTGTMPVGGFDGIAVACETNAYAIGGHVSGLAAPGLVLQLNDAGDLAVDADGPFAFAPRLPSGSVYAVSILALPPGHACTLSGATGSVVDADVDVGVSCAEVPQLALTLDDGGDFARYGHFVDFVATLYNDGGAARDVAVTFRPSPGYDADHAQWSCHGAGAGASCEHDASEPTRFVVTLPSDRSLTWLVHIPVRGDAAGDSVEFAVEADGATEVRDVNALVLFRDGFDVPYGDGTQRTPIPGGARAVDRDRHESAEQVLRRHRDGHASRCNALGVIAADIGSVTLSRAGTFSRPAPVWPSR